MSFFIYQDNVDPRDRTAVVEFDRTDGTRARFEKGKSLDLTSDEISRLSRLIQLVPGTAANPVQSLPAPVYTNPATGKIDPAYLPPSAVSASAQPAPALPISFSPYLEVGANWVNNALPGNWTDIDPTGKLDVTVPAQVGDEVEAGLTARLATGATTTQVMIDFFVVSGTSGRSWSTQQPLNNGHASPAVYWEANKHYAVSYRISKKVQATDLSQGFITLRPKWKGAGGSTVTLYGTHAGGDYGLRIINHKSDRVLALVADQAWQQSAVFEPNVYEDTTKVLGDPDRWVMIYTGGWTASRLGYATAPTVRGPWTNKSVTSPFLGGSAGGWAGGAARSSINYDATRPSGQRLLVWFANPQGVAGEGIRLAMGNSPADIVYQRQVIAAPAGFTRMANTSVLVDATNVVMMVEGFETASSIWKTGYATASSITGDFTMQTIPVLGLAHDAGGMFGGPNLFKRGATYILWYHAGFNAMPGNIPTEIFRATSTDLINWTKTPWPLIRRAHPYEYDQVADVFVIPNAIPTEPSDIYWDGDNNVAQTAWILRADPARFGLIDV